MCIGGIVGDIVSTSIIATKAQVLIVPAMNTAMYEKPIVQNNIERLKSFGYKFLEPEVETMAMKGKKEGAGRLPKPESIVDNILKMKF